VLFADIVKSADVGVVQSRRRARLPTEALLGHRIAGNVVGKQLEGDEAAQTRVFGFVHNPHTAAAELFHDAIVRDLPAYHTTYDWGDDKGSAGRSQFVVLYWERSGEEVPGDTQV